MTGIKKNSKKKVSKKRSPRFDKGGISFGPPLILIIIAIFSFTLVGGMSMQLSPNKYSDDPEEKARLEALDQSGSQVIVTIPDSSDPNNLKMKTFSVVNACTASTVDVVLIIDHSSTMRGEKLVAAKEAAKSFVDTLSSNAASRFSLVIFDKIGERKTDLSHDVPTIKAAIDAIPESIYTCIQCGLKVANDHILPNKRPQVKSIGVLLTDGRGNHVNGVYTDSALANQKALEEAKNGNITNKTTYHTIGFGADEVPSFLQAVADGTDADTKGMYISTHNNPDMLKNAFSTIAASLCQ